FGVFQVPAEETAETVAHALETGYRAIDTAAAYGNEDGVRDGLLTSGLEPAWQGPAARRSGDRRNRLGPRSHSGPGRAALAHPARQRGDPEVGHTLSDRGELPGVRLRAEC